MTCVDCLYLLNHEQSTGWIMFAVSGIMQCILLIMCIAWKFRQRRLGIDDFGHPIDTQHDDDSVPYTSSPPPVLRTSIHAGLPMHNDAVGRTAAQPVYEEPASDIEIVRAMLGESSPLLKNGKMRKSSTMSSKRMGWLGSIRRPSTSD